MADQGHTSVFLFILTVRVRRFFTFVFSFSCKLLISNGQPPSLMLGSVFALASYAGHAGWRHVCVFLCVSARRQVRRTGRRPMPHCRPARPNPVGTSTYLILCVRFAPCAS